MIKTASFSVQMVEFIFKRLNFNLNKLIRHYHVLTL
jgi:hypothetical protein